MQKICWIVLLAATGLLAQRAAAAEPLMPIPPSELPAIGNNAYQMGQTAAGCAQPSTEYPSGIFCTCSHPKCCHCASAYDLAPGCCEARRHCFDNAWDGYCERRAHWDTVWCKVGTGALYPCTPCPTYDGRGVAFEVQLRPAAAACGCCQKH
jgi:hypothetical protein